MNNTSEVAARIVKGRIEKTCLGEIAEYIREVYDPAKSFLQVKLDLRAIAALRLDVDVQSYVPTHSRAINTISVHQRCMA